MKYIDAKKLIAEIERRLKILEPHKDTFESAAACRQELIWVKDFITSLQQEHPEVGFETEYAKFSNDPNAEDYALPIDLSDYKDFARHFFELGRKASKSVWHNVAEEVPTEIGAEVVVACKNKNKEDGIWLYDLIQCWEGEWKPRVNWEKPIRWAYVRDLDNERKEK